MSDLHLDFCTDEEIRRMVAGIPIQPGDAVAVTGDIGTAPRVQSDLWTLAASLPVPIYFVLGNHDFYHGSLRGVRMQVRQAAKRAPSLYWLSESDPIALDDRTWVVGHDGWADAGLGDYARSTVELNDYYLIDEFVGLARPERRILMESQAARSVGHLAGALAEVPPSVTRILVLTHVPPFADVCLAPDGGGSDDEWLPHFTNRRLGEFLVAFAKSRPSVRVLVLCGHSHTRAAARMRPNLEVRVAGSDYGHPRVEEVIDLDRWDG